MEIRMQEKKLNEGENYARTLQISVDDACAAHEIRLAFLTPAGRRLLTPPIALTDGNAQYLLPACVLDAGGRLLAQIIAESDTLQITKSEVFGFDVDRSIPLDGAVTDGGTLITLGGVYSDLLDLQAEVALCARQSELPSVPEQVSAFRNDADYATRAYVLDTVAAAEREAMPAHTHDDRYYTETETDALLQAKADAYDVTTGLAGKVDIQPFLALESIVDGKADKTELPQEKTGTFTPNFTMASGSFLRVRQIGNVVYLEGTIAIDGTLADATGHHLGDITGVDRPLSSIYIPVLTSSDGNNWTQGSIGIAYAIDNLYVGMNVKETDSMMIVNGFYTV